jgi:hypothetical protein
VRVQGLTNPHVRIELAAPRPDAWLKGRGNIVPLPYTGLDAKGEVSLGFSLDGRDCDEFIEFMAEEHRSPIGYRLGYYPDQDWWKDPDEAWVGAEVLGDGFATLSPENKFAPSCPEPCYGHVPPDEVIHVTSRPRGNVVGVKFDELYSDRMAAFFVRQALCRIGRVHFQGRIWPEHVRLFPEQSKDVLATEFMRRGNCRMCASPNLIWPVPNLGVRVDDLVVCRNERGTGHCVAQYPLIVSVSVAQELKRQIRGGYGLDPILDVDSPLGKRILDVEKKLHALVGSRCPS